MGFDIQRAVTESFGGRISLTDRILSYLYFSGLDVVEQSAWDELGSGVTLIARKGQGSEIIGALLACPLPNGPLSLGDQSPFGIIKVSWFVDLMAKIWALSEIDTTKLRLPLYLIAYRPDPFARSLLCALDGGGIHGKHALVYSPVGKTPCQPSCGVGLCAISFDLGHYQKERRSHRAVQTYNICHLNQTNITEAFLSTCQTLLDAHQRGIMDLLDFRLSDAYDLIPGNEISFSIGLHDTSWSPPSHWVLKDKSPKNIYGIRWESIIAMVVSAINNADMVGRRLWKEANRSCQPNTKVIPLMFYGDMDELTFLLAVPMPPTKKLSPGEATDLLIKAINPAEDVDKASVCGVVRYLVVGKEEWKMGNGPLGVASFLAPTFKYCHMMGPTFAEVSEDPGRVAEEYARIYLSYLKEVLRI